MKETLKKSAILAAAASMLAGMTACGPTVPFSPQGRGPAVNPSRVGTFAASPRARAGKKWTVMIHLAGDNNLYSFGLEDVNEMEAGLAQNPAAAEALDVIVLFDGTPQGDSKILRIKPDPGPVNKNIISEVIDDKGAVIPPSKEVDSGDPVVATKFVDFVTKNFPSENNFHAFWNHGSGIFRSGVNSPEFNAGTSFFDTVIGGNTAPGQRRPGMSSKVFAADDHGTEMYLRDVNGIFSVAKQNLGKPMDVVGFDACLMQHAETAYQYKGLANILVASEELEPGKGWDYAAWIGAIAKNPNLNPPQVSKALVDTFIASYMGGSAGRATATLSAVDINVMNDQMVPALNEYAAALQASLPAAKAAIATARSQTQGFYNRDAADLGDFLKKYTAVNRDPRAGAAGNKLQAAIQQSVIAQGNTGGKVANATGMQVYFPNATMNFNQKYADPSFLRFAETQGWGNFLKAFTAK